MKILYLSHRIPYPPNKGDKIRSLNEIKHLSSIHEIDLACLADDPADLKHEGDLKEYCKQICIAPLKPLNAKAKSIVSLASSRPLSVGYFYSRSLQNIINGWLSSNSYDAVICFSSPMAEYLFRSPSLESIFSINPGVSREKRVTSNAQPATRNPQLVMDFCDLDSDKWRQYSLDSAFPLNLIYRIEASLLLRYEKRINRQFDHSIFISHQEADLFLRLYPEAKNVTVIPNGVDYEYFSPTSLSLEPSASDHNKTPILLFTGAMDYHANVDGVAWFCDEIFSLVKREFSGSRFFIVGSNPTHKVRALDRRDGVTVTGFVEDIRPYYQMADVCVIPLRMARGVQNKVLEAMAMGKAVVTTTRAAEGIMAVSGEHVLVQDTAKGFINAVSKLVKDQKAGKALGTRARELVTEKYDWSTNMKKFDTLLQK